MAAAVETFLTHNNSAMETIVDFSPELVKAPFLLRSAAFCVDYMVLLVVPVGWLVMSRLLSDKGAVTVGPMVWVIGVVFFLLDFIVLPVFGGRTIGKLVLGLTILNADGSRAGLVGIIKRNIVGYLLTALTLGVGFLISALNASGRSLHDFVGGTIVVRGRRTQV